MDDELLAQPQVMKLLDSLREQYTRYQEVCRQRSKRTQLEEIQQKVMQVSLELFLNTVRWRFKLKSQTVFPAKLKIRDESFMLPFTPKLQRTSSLLTILCSGYDSDFPKAVLICGGDRNMLTYDHAEEPSRCPFVAYCGSVPLRCRSVKCLTS